MRPSANLSGTASKPMPAHFGSLKVFTMGEIARACRVAPRTVTRWFDGGELKGYRIPVSGDRRVPRESLVAFMGRHRMADALAAVGGVTFVAVGVECDAGAAPAGWESRRAGEYAGAHAAMGSAAVRAVLVHGSVGSSAARRLAAAVRAARPDDCPLLVLVAGDGDPGECEGFDAVLTEGFAPAAFWSLAEAAVTS